MGHHHYHFRHLCSMGGRKKRLFLFGGCMKRHSVGLTPNSTSSSQTNMKVQEHTSHESSTYHQPPVKYNTVFSTGCSLYQDWQSYVFIFHALHSGQEEHTTRIAPDCEGDAKNELEKIFKDEIAPIIQNDYICIKHQNTVTSTNENWHSNTSTNLMGCLTGLRMCLDTQRTKPSTMTR